MATEQQVLTQQKSSVHSDNLSNNTMVENLSSGVVNSRKRLPPDAFDLDYEDEKSVRYDTAGSASTVFTSGLTSVQATNDEFARIKSYVESVVRQKNGKSSIGLTDDIFHEFIRRKYGLSKNVEKNLRSPYVNNAVVTGTSVPQQVVKETVKPSSLPNQKSDVFYNFDDLNETVKIAAAKKLDIKLEDLKKVYEHRNEILKTILTTSVDDLIKKNQSTAILVHNDDATFEDKTQHNADNSKNADNVIDFSSKLTKTFDATHGCEDVNSFNGLALTALNKESKSDSSDKSESRDLSFITSLSNNATVTTSSYFIGGITKVNDPVFIDQLDESLNDKRVVIGRSYAAPPTPKYVRLYKCSNKFDNKELKNTIDWSPPQRHTKQESIGHHKPVWIPYIDPNSQAGPQKPADAKSFTSLNEHTSYIQQSSSNASTSIVSETSCTNCGSTQTSQWRLIVGNIHCNSCYAKLRRWALKNKRSTQNPDDALEGLKILRFSSSRNN